MSLAILFHFLCAQHVSDINISIIRSLRLCWWITTSVVLFSVRFVLGELEWLALSSARVAGWSTTLLLIFFVYNIFIVKPCNTLGKFGGWKDHNFIINYYSQLKQEKSAFTVRMFLGAFEKLRKATISFVMTVRPSVCPHGPTRLRLDGFHEIWYLHILGKNAWKIQVSLKSDKNNGYFVWRTLDTFDHISLHSS